MIKYTFSLVFVIYFIPIRPTAKKIIGDKLVTDRQTDIFELTHIHMGKILFFCILEGGNELGKIYTSLLAKQVCFTCRGDNEMKTIMVEQRLLYSQFTF